MPPASAPTEPEKLAPDCHNIIPAERIDALQADGLEPDEDGFSEGVQKAMDDRFAANGGVHCSWIQPGVPSDAFMIFAYSQISAEESMEVQAVLMESGWYTRSDLDGRVVLQTEAGAPAVYLFGGGAWAEARTLEDAELVLETAASAIG